MTQTKTFAGGHGAPSTVTFYSPDQKRDPLGMWTKDDEGAEPMDWEKAKSMSQAEWNKLSDTQKAGLLAAVYVADADKKPGASAALAKLRGWVSSDKGGKGGGGGGGKSNAEKAAEKKKREAEAAKKKADAEKAKAERAKNARRVRPDAVNSGHRDGYIIGESEDGNTRMRWDKENETYVIEKRDGKNWKENRRLKPEQAYNELAKEKPGWYRPKVQPFLQNETNKPAKKPTSKPSSSESSSENKSATKQPSKAKGPASGRRPGRKPSAKELPLNTGRVDLTAAAEKHTGAMIALVPSDEDAITLAVDGGEEPDQLHMTEVYLGDADQYDDDERQYIIDVVSDFAERWNPVAGEAFSVNMFNPPGFVKADGKQRDSCVVLGISGDDVADFHDSLLEVLDDEEIEYPAQHVPRVPHVTLVYTDDADLSAFTEKTGPLTFDKIRVAFGDDVYDIPLGEDHEEEITAGAFKFDPKQPRDAEGQWTDAPGSGAAKKLPKPTDAASLWKNRKDYLGKVIAIRYVDRNGERKPHSRLVLIENDKGKIVARPETLKSAYPKDHPQYNTWFGEDDGYDDIKSAKKLQEEMEWLHYEFTEPEEAHPNGSPYDKPAPPPYVEPTKPMADEPGTPEDEQVNLPESDAPDGWAEGGSDPDVMAKERRDVKSWDELQRNALYGYTMDATTFNETLRKAKGKKPRKGTLDENGTDLGEAIPAIDSAMYAQPRDITVFRQIHPSAFGVSSIEELKALEGQDFTDFGYLSTSVNFKQNLPGPLSDVHMKIKVPKGKKAAYIADVSMYPEQSELLLARGSKLRVTGVEYKNGRAFLTMEVV